MNNRPWQQFVVGVLAMCTLVVLGTEEFKYVWSGYQITIHEIPQPPKTYTVFVWPLWRKLATAVRFALTAYGIVLGVMRRRSAVWVLGGAFVAVSALFVFDVQFSMRTEFPSPTSNWSVWLGLILFTSALIARRFGVLGGPSQAQSAQASTVPPNKSLERDRDA